MTEFMKGDDPGPSNSDVVKEAITVNGVRIEVYNSAPEPAPTSSPAPQSQED